MKIAVLMSGGVDSTVSALLLKEQGYNVLGLTMINWDLEVGDKAKESARSLGLEHKIVDLRKIFADRVVNYFCQTYERGLTPNPCVQCNRYIKFDVLLEIARQEDCDMIATGHYARIEFDKLRNRYLLKKGRDSLKDQSYFLYALQQEQLSRAIFPLGDFTKEQVKQLARERGFKVAQAKESQEICFVSGKYQDFIEDKVAYHSGDIRDKEGKLLGKHRGLPFYTIGQRKGLGISGGKPLYVTVLDPINNVLRLGEERELYSSSFKVKQNNFIFRERVSACLETEVKIRYAAAPALATIKPENDGIRVSLKSPQRAVTPGQSAVYYLGEYVLGGGIIEQVEGTALD